MPPPMARPGPNTSQQPPISFRTVPGRHKTQKWTTAKTVDYGGDDWGGYDDYDDDDDDDGGYGDDQQQQQAPLPPPQPPYAQQQQRPVQQQQQRQNSFDSGEERRAFSGPGAFYGSAGGGAESPSARSAGSGGGAGGGRGSNDYDGGGRQRRRDFTNPESVPLPLSMRSSPGPAGAAGYFPPPRKSSASRGSPAPDAVPQPSSTAKEKDLPTPPFIRPSDIYKRMAEAQEKERKSLDGSSSSRPSMEGLSRSSESPAGSAVGRRPLSSVEETAQQQQQQQESSPRSRQGPSVQAPLNFGDLNEQHGLKRPDLLPNVQGVSAFGSDFLTRSGQGSTGNDNNEDEQTPTTLRAVQQSTISSLQSTPTVATRAPPGSDPAAEILAERTTTRAAQQGSISSFQPTPAIATRAPSGSDPAAEILAERTATRAPPGSDPAADILAERTHSTPISNIGLMHQPSQGYRSIVHKAFDRSKEDDNSNSMPGTPVSRDGSLLGGTAGSGSGVSRSNTDSTSGISPIMSRVPSAATAQQRQLEREGVVPTIAEEPQQQQQQQQEISETYRIPRKPSPGHSRNTSAETAKPEDTSSYVVQPGYRRSLDPPTSADNSPARTPGLEDVRNRRLSGPMAAETVTPPVEHEPPAVEDQGVEMQPQMNLQRTGTDWSDYSQSMYSQPVSSPTTGVGGRARAGTDYSLREADVAEEVNSSPDKADFDVRQQAEREREDFLKQHSEPEPASGRSSPAKGGRVRALVDGYTGLQDEGRRNSGASSKSSWSDFRGSEENLPAALRKKGTGGGEEKLGVQEQQDAGRPEMVGREQSFRPHLPGEWVSYARTPSETPPPPPVADETLADEDEEPTRQPGAETSPLTPTASRGGPPVSEEPVDLTPTTKKFPLSASHSPPQATSSMNPRDSAGLPMSEEQVDFTPTTKRFPLSGSHSPTQPTFPTSPTSARGPGGAPFFTQAKTAGDALGASLVASHSLGHQTRDFASAAPAPPVDQPETASRVPTGALGYWQPPARPELNRGETDASLATATSEVPPTPPAKDSDAMDKGGERVGPTGRPVSNYFSGAPLKMGREREVSPENEGAGVGAGGLLRPTALSMALSTDTGRSDLESDRLRKEIVKSLDGDAQRTQDALDAPDNMRRVEGVGKALPAAEISGGDRPLPRMLDQRFSWEDRPPVASELAIPPKIREPEPAENSPEIKPEMPYERPRSRGLHIVNAGEESSDEEVHPAAVDAAGGESNVKERGLRSAGPVSPITKSQENLHTARTVEEREAAGEGSDLPELLPSPLSETEGATRFLPSYYTQDALSIEPPTSHEALASAAADATPDAAPEQKIVDDSTTQQQNPTPTSPSKNKKIPPFREILAIKTPSDRIRTYDETRQTFADMDTGLADWLSGMLAQHPEHAALSTPRGGFRPPALQTSGTGIAGKGHKHSPSLAKFTKNFNMPGSSSGGERKASMDMAGGGRSASGGAGGGGGGPAGTDVPPKPPAKDFGVPNVDMDKMQQRGKDLMKGAGVLGGKAQAGAKGLLAKGRSRFGTQRESRGGVGGGSSKAVLAPTSSSLSSSTSTSTAPIPAPQNENNTAALQSTVLSEPTGTSSLAPSVTQHSSSYSASPSPSPIPNPAFLQSKTTSSSSLSRTLSRLRERSRSKSTTRSKSRPTSLVLTNPDLVTLEDASPLGFAGGAVAAAGPSAVSTWNEPDAAVSPWAELDAVAAFQPIERSVTPGRLGILPSPAVDTFSMVDESPTKTVRGLSTGAEAAAAAEQAREGHGSVREVWRPSHARKSSDLASLPSRQRGLEFNPKSPGSPALPPEQQQEDGGDEDKDELYASTPVTAKAGGPRSLTFGVGTGGEDDENTPIAAETSGAALPRAVEMPQGPQESPHVRTESIKHPRLEIKPGGDGEIPAPMPSQNELPPEQDATTGAQEEGASTPDKADVADVDTEAALATESSHPDVSRPSTGDDWEKRSEVSAAGDFHDAEDGLETKDDTKAPSRRSSVSSLGSPGVSGTRTPSTAFVSASQTEMQLPVMSSQAVPAGPIGPAKYDPRAQQAFGDTSGRIDSMVPPSISRDNTPQQQRFTNRSYLFGDTQDERPRSYVSLERDASGGLVQESLDTTTQLSTASVDLSGFSGPPTGTPPFQQHPLMRSPAVGSMQPTEHETLRSPLPSSTKPMMRSRRPSVDAADRASKRFSGLFRGRDQRPTTTVEGPAPSAISDSYGLEGLQSDASNMIIGDPKYQQDQRQARRGSRIWETFKRTPSVKRPDLSRESSGGRLDAQPRTAFVAADKSREGGSRPTTLKKPERAVSAATQAEPKKKRFSGLGSLFGRSSTTGHNSEKPKRLTKTQQPSREFSQKQGPAPSQDAKGYDAYEAKRRQQIPDLQQRRPDNNYPPPQTTSSHTFAAPARNFQPPLPPPPEGWYTPSENQSRSTPGSHAQHPPQNFRRLHSEGFKRDSSFSNVPEAYRPTEASFGRPAAPVGPAPEQWPPEMYSPPTSPVGSGPLFRQSPMPSMPYQRHSSSGTAEHQLSPLVSGQSEFQRSDWRPRGSSPSISPVQSRTGSEGFMADQAVRVGSISEEIGRSPAQAYAQQQTPWAISMPQGVDGSKRSSRASSWAMQGGGMWPQRGESMSGPGFSDMAPPAGYYQPQHGLPMSPQSPQSGMPMRYPSTTPPPHVTRPLPPYRDPQMRNFRGAEGGGYPSPPYSPEAALYGPPRRPSQGRYYAQPSLNEGLPPQPKLPYGPPRQFSGNGPPIYNRRTSSGYTGRRDDPAVSEEALDMRGASYPGQEWSPSQWD